MSSLAWGFRGAALYYHCSKESSKHTARPCTTPPAMSAIPPAQKRHNRNRLGERRVNRDPSSSRDASEEGRQRSLFRDAQKDANTVLPLLVILCVPPSVSILLMSTTAT